MRRGALSIGAIGAIGAIVALLASSLALAIAGCSPGDEVEIRTGSAVEHGAALFADPRTSSSPSNVVSCATCHPTVGRSADRIFSGGSLAGATRRASFWGGHRVDLLESINDCRLSFMDARTPWTRDDEDARAMYAYLESLAGPADPLPFDVDPKPPALGGDPARGAMVFDRACRTCHGAAHDAAGRLVPFAPLLPEEIARTHPGSPAELRAFYVRRVRQGSFASTSGSMPPFSRQSLGDGDLAALLAFLGI